jgi:ABC-type sugar transport system ATPase subunit
VVVTHDEEVAARCGRVVRLRDGRIVERRTRVGTTGEMQLIETPDAGGSGVAGSSEAPGPEAPRPTASGTVTSANGHRR